MQTLRVFSRAGCHLCECLIEELLPIVRGRLEVEVFDIDTRPEWIEQYGSRVPVVEYRDQVICQYRLDRDAVQAILETVDRS